MCWVATTQMLLTLMLKMKRSSENESLSRSDDCFLLVQVVVVLCGWMGAHMCVYVFVLGLVSVVNSFVTLQFVLYYI